MSSAQFITVRECAQILGIAEGKVMELIEKRELQAYRIADQFLRLKRSEVMALRNTGEVESESLSYDYTSAERIRDFFYFNDFYLVSLVICLILLYIIFFT